MDASNLTLAKGGSLTLQKGGRNLKQVTIGLGWQTSTRRGVDFDLDASAIMCKADGLVPSDRYFIFYNQLISHDGTVEHMGDDLTGGDGAADDEVIKVNLEAMESVIRKIIFPVSIYEAHARRQRFGLVHSAYIRVVDTETGQEVARYNLTDEASNDTAMVFGELHRNGDTWSFHAVGQAYASGLGGIAREHGVNI